MSSPQSLIDKINALPAEFIDEVEDFVDFLATRALDRALVCAAARASAPRIWDNPEDGVYDAL